LHQVAIQNLTKLSVRVVRDIALRKEQFWRGNGIGIGEDIVRSEAIGNARNITGEIAVAVARATNGGDGIVGHDVAAGSHTNVGRRPMLFDQFLGLSTLDRWSGRRLLAGSRFVRWFGRRVAAGDRALIFGARARGAMVLGSGRQSRV
jgi:hypothetical protein